MSLIDPMIKMALDSAKQAAEVYANPKIAAGERDVQSLLNAFNGLYNAVTRLAEDVKRLEAKVI